MYCTASIFPEILLIPALLQLLLGAASLAGGFRFHKYVVSRLESQPKEFEGLVSVFVPCRGDEPGLGENLEKILDQNRTAFEVLFIVDDRDDTAVPIIEAVRKGHPNTKLVVAGRASDCGQKVYNLQMGIIAADRASAAYVFVDSDARPGREWLTDLLSPLNALENGCSTGYRWFVQNRGGLATHICSVWNASIASSLGAGTDSNFCWGGSMAIKRSVFEELNVAARWNGVLSDDFVLTNVIKDSKYGIYFEPRCLTASVGDFSFRELLEFTTRQMKITRVYSPGHFKVSFVGAALFAGSVLPAVASLPYLYGSWFSVTILILALIWFLGFAKAVLRVYTISLCLPGYDSQLKKQYLSHPLLWPFSTFLFLINDAAALISRKIVWRGITYELVSEQETRILKQ